MSDCDKVFLSKFWKKLHHLQGIVLNRNSAYQPQTNSQLEVVNHCIETYLQCFVSDTPKQWQAWSKYWRNTSFYVAAQTTPFRVLYGKDPPSLVCFGRGTTCVSTVEQALEERDATLEELKCHLSCAQ